MRHALLLTGLLLLGTAHAQEEYRKVLVDNPYMCNGYFIKDVQKCRDAGIAAIDVEIHGIRQVDGSMVDRTIQTFARNTMPSSLISTNQDAISTWCKWATPGPAASTMPSSSTAMVRPPRRISVWSEAEKKLIMQRFLPHIWQESLHINPLDYKSSLSTIKQHGSWQSTYPSYSPFSFIQVHTHKHPLP